MQDHILHSQVLTKSNSSINTATNPSINQCKIRENSKAIRRNKLIKNLKRTLRKFKYKTTKMQRVKKQESKLNLSTFMEEEPQMMIKDSVQIIKDF